MWGAGCCVSATERGGGGGVSAGERGATTEEGAKLASLRLLLDDVCMSEDASSEASNVDQETGSRRSG